MELLPVKPQWAPAAKDPVERLLNKNTVVFEWGNGMSTPWIAERVKYLFAMDHDVNWSNLAKKYCERRSIGNVDFFVYREDHLFYHEAIYYISEMIPIDIAIVDGVNRVECFKKAVKYVKKGGLIILDDSQRGEYAEAWAFPGIRQVAEYGTSQKTTIYKKL